MSFFSKSSKGNHYKTGHHGSSHYQKKKGLLGNLFNLIGSRSGSDGHYKTYPHQHPDKPVHSQPVPNQGIHVCGKCSAQIPAGSKFCLECGEKVNTTLFCMNCGEKLPPHAKFCHKCGTKLDG